MNWDHIEANWKLFTKKIQQKWGSIPEDQIEAIEGNRDCLASKIEHIYGISKEEATRQIGVWQERQNETVHLMERAGERNAMPPINRKMNASHLAAILKITARTFGSGLMTKIAPTMKLLRTKDNASTEHRTARVSLAANTDDDAIPDKVIK